MIENVSFTVSGLPQPKGSFTRMPNGAMLPAGTTASRKRVKDWRDDIRREALDAMGSNDPTRKAVRLMVDFSLPYPQSSIRKYQLGWYPNIKQPDIDKLLRGLLDALTGIVWVDDSQVISCHVNKSYAWNGKPGAHIVADFLSDEWLRQLGTHRESLLKAMEGIS